VTPEAFTVVAQNLPEHAGNLIHTDEGARAAGFERALVAGVTTYAYLTHPIVDAWGEDWVAGGGGEVRFRRPVFDQDTVECRPRPDGDAVLVEALTGTGDDPRATLRAVRSAAAPTQLPTERLPTITAELTGEFGFDYGLRAGEHLDLYVDRRIVHPAVWSAMGNLVMRTFLVRGPWIHTRSLVRHHAVAHDGDVADLSSGVVRRFTHRHGESAVIEVRIEVRGRLVASLEHEAIVSLAG
jgi:acyl dehydratase